MTGTPAFFPYPLPEWVRANPRRRAECRTYDALQQQLSGPWHVYYSRPWLGLDRDGRDKEGEADFVVAHPEYGMLVLEVKGGEIRYDATRDQWTTRNEQGDTFRIRNPAQQAMTNKHELLRKLREQPGWNGRFINACIGVVFPDCHVPRDLTPSLPRFAVAGIDQMHHLGEWVEARLSAGDDRQTGRASLLGEDGIALLDRFFAASFELQRAKAATLLHADTELRILTERQAFVLQMLEHHRRLAIPGAAGTGKTALATTKARLLDGQGLRTLLLCYNRPLAIHLRNELEGIAGLEVASFHAYVRKLARRAGLPLPDLGPDSRDDSGRLAATLTTSLARLPDERFDAIVVDEGQDLDEGWLPAVKAMLRDPENGTLYVFYDDNQRVYGRALSIEAGVRRSDVRLNRVLRNTRPIAESYRALLPDAVVIDGPDGPAVEFRPVASTGLATTIAYTVGDLINRWHVAPEMIAVLFRDVQSRDAFSSAGIPGSVKLSDAETAAAGSIVCDSVRRFKGLECQVALLVEPSKYCGQLELLYVGMSRARTHLILIDTAAGLQEVRAVLAAARLPVQKGFSDAKGGESLAGKN